MIKNKTALKWLKQSLESATNCDFSIKKLKGKTFGPIEISPKKISEDCPAEFSEMVGKKFLIVMHEVK